MTERAIDVMWTTAGQISDVNQVIGVWWSETMQLSTKRHKNRSVLGDATLQLQGRPTVT